MIAPFADRNSISSTASWHHRFLAMLPTIRRQVRLAFAGLPPEERAEAIQEAIVNSLVAHLALLKRGKEDLAYPTPLARYAVAHVRAGRTTGCRLNSHEPLSRYAMRKRGFFVERLDRLEADTDVWQETLVEDKRCTPAEVAAVRLDFAEWLKLLPTRDRRIAIRLATGETTRETARRFRISPGRISQLRIELAQNWAAFQGEQQRI
ncbi:MAG: hypothetical protein WD894_14850 [Pirellulales bacterium]